MPAQQSGAQAPPRRRALRAGSQVAFAPPPPPPPPPNPRPANMKTGNAYSERFLELWTDIHDLKERVLQPRGRSVPLRRNLLVEAPDYGHETTSEAFSYYVWLEAMYGKVTGDYSQPRSGLEDARVLHHPEDGRPADEPVLPPNKPATFAEERDTPQQYPPNLDGLRHPRKIRSRTRLKRTYGKPDLYAMHWLLDVDNFYGYGNHGDGTSRVSYINTFQRGAQESCWETIPHPSWEEFKWGKPERFLGCSSTSRTPPSNGDTPRRRTPTRARSRPSTGPSAGADEAGGNPLVDALMQKGAMMGD
jgi:hypothetical protein